MLKVFLLGVLIVFSYAEDSWSDRFEVQVEAGVLMNEFDGDLKNPTSTLDFAKELSYEDTYSSYLGLKIKNDYEYLPQLSFNFIDMKEESDSVFSESKEVANWDFAGSVTSQTKYRVANLVLHNSYKLKGSMQKFLRWQYYTGDVEFNIGVNIKYINYSLRVKNNVSGIPEPYAYVNINTFVAQPYIGMTYYWYDLGLFANGSALSISNTKARNYQVGVEYRLYKDLYLSASYLFEDFQATELKDKVDFKTYGNKFTFKYIF